MVLLGLTEEVDPPKVRLRVSEDEQACLQTEISKVRAPMDYGNARVIRRRQRRRKATMLPKVLELPDTTMSGFAVALHFANIFATPGMQNP